MPAKPKKPAIVIMIGAKPPRPKMSEAMDDRMDKRASIKESSAKDRALDKKRGLPADKKGK